VLCPSLTHPYALQGYYVKTAQILASKDEFLPPPWTRRLARLWDAMPPRRWRAVRAALAHELRRTPAAVHAFEAAFASVDAVPLAAASVAQVHAGVLQSDPPWADASADVAAGGLTARDVVIKVQARAGHTQLLACLARAASLADASRFARSLARSRSTAGWST
jgi:predicted unusual protein kinase regulating ubiquinone biosynthesis (AarF/ABC1/UbiB family)